MNNSSDAKISNPSSSSQGLPPLIPAASYLPNAIVDPPPSDGTGHLFETPSPIPGISTCRPSLMDVVPYLFFPLRIDELDSPLFSPDSPRSTASALNLRATFNPETKKYLLQPKSESEVTADSKAFDIFVLGPDNWSTFAAKFHSATANLHSTYPLQVRYPIPVVLQSASMDEALDGAIRGVIFAEQRLIANKYQFPFSETGRARDYYQKAATLAMTRFNADWVPRPLSSEEIASYREDTQAWIVRIQQMQYVRDTIATRDARVEDELFFCRIEYRARFGRIFRVNDLPSEILNNIFRLVVWSAPDPKQGVNWRLWSSWVCQRWRSTVLEDSTLWNAIWFRDPPNFERSFAWLDRSGTAPLDVRFNDSKKYKFTLETMNNLLDKIFVKISTIRMLIVIVEDWKAAVAIINKLRIVGAANIPSILERFELHRDAAPLIESSPGFNVDEFHAPIPLFGGAVVPTLNYLSLNGVYIDWTKSHLRNLTTLDVRRISMERGPSLSRFRDMLKDSPRLRKLILDGAGPSTQDSRQLGDLPPVPLPELKILILANFSPAYGLFLLPQFEAPNVADLTLMDFDGFDYGNFYARLASCFPRVQLLTFWNANSTWSDRARQCLVKWLDAMPTITYLRVSRVRVPLLETFLYDAKTLAYPSSQSPKLLCPKLRVFEVHGLDASGADPLIRWVSRRREIGLPIQKVYILKKVAQFLTKEQYQTLATTGASISILPDGATTAEETEITSGA